MLESNSLPMCVFVSLKKKIKKDGFKMELESLDFRYRNPKFEKLMDKNQNDTQTLG